MSDASPHDPKVPPGPPPSLSDELEDEVLCILDGDEAVRESALRDLLDAHPEHAGTIRAWLTRANVPLPAIVTTGGTVVDGGDLETLPQQLGRYRLLERIGRGGFGTVFRAEQREPFVRPVAIKVLNPGMDSREVLARFSAEREALNRMDHPGIARLLDAGTTPQGRPFFVMEIVAGPPLATMCRQRNTPLRERLELFLLVLDAMQHAHQKAVLHRDLSSNNVLVAEIDGRLQPKIIDFGIAKSLADPLLAGGAMTFQGTLLGTPEFMSPEQAAGDTGAIDTRSDVYALGVQLYELLTDQLPIPSHVLRAQGVTGMARVIREHRPWPPSEAAVTKNKEDLRGDLDAITMTAIAKERDERYATVAELAADIRAYLDCQPIQAVTPSEWYRLAKFVRRHRAESAAVAVVAIGLVIATGVLWWALSIANEALAESESQKQVIAERADAGFRLLANEERLIAATAAARALPPPWPAHKPEYRAWLEDYGVPLAEELPKLREKLDTLRDKKLRSLDQQFADMADQHLLSALERLERDMQDFAETEGGYLARVRHRLRFLTERVQPELSRRQLQWQRTIEGIRQTHGGLTLYPVPGLVPLGPSPDTGRYEFLDLASHEPDLPVPPRAQDTGELQCSAGTGIVFTLIPAGLFRIGAVRDRPGLPQNDPFAENDELGGQLVNLDDFLIARTELTTAQWAALSGTTPPDPGNARLPVTGIDWHTARRVLREFDLDLPTEAQWEYACRGTTTSPWASGSDADTVAAMGWIQGDPRPVASLRKNAYGLFDMHGNVAEWCRDEMLDYGEFEPRSDDGLRQRESPTDDEARRVVRGGASFRGAIAARSAARDAHPPATRDSGIGVRPIRRLR